MDSHVASSTNQSSAAYCNSPHIKKVLKSYQKTSMTSLNGPDTRSVYGVGYGLEKEMSLPMMSQYSHPGPVLHSTKSNLVSADGGFYKKRHKTISSASSYVGNGISQTTLISAKNSEPAANGKETRPNSISNSGDNNNNDTATSANKNSKNTNVEINNVAAAVAAVSSTSKLNGIDSAAENNRTFDEERNSFENDLFLGPPPFPIQQVPILTAADQGWSESKTLLEGEMISCFVVGGEKRLCLPQILNTVLRDFSLPQINSVCDDLQIYCSRCSQEQLGALKITGILPPSAPSCGLVTKTDCERLCNALLHRYLPKAIHNLPPEKRPFHFRIYHECFGKCEGIYTPDHYTSPDARCIECVDCHGLMSPQKFVGHVHVEFENRTCHWGFDSMNWRSYILLAKGQESTNHLKGLLDEMKEQFDNTKNNRKRKTRTTSIKTEVIEYDDEEGRLQQQQLQQSRLEEREDDLEVKEDATVYKKRKTELTDTYYPYVYDPVFCYYNYSGSPFQPHNASALSRTSAFRPWSPLLTTKEGKFNLNLPPSAVAFTRESAQRPLPAYLSRGPPVLLNPERVVPISETERFERHYQPNVALAPPSAQQLLAKQKSHPCHKETNPLNSRVNIREQPVSDKKLKPVTNKKSPESLVASNSDANAAGGLSQSGQDSDMELSTDTEETFSDSNSCSSSESHAADGCTGTHILTEKGSSNISTEEEDIVSVEMKLLRQLLDEEVSDKGVRHKVLTKVARMCYKIEQKFEQSHRQLQKEVALTRIEMSKGEHPTTLFFAQQQRFCDELEAFRSANNKLQEELKLLDSNSKEVGSFDTNHVHNCLNNTENQESGDEDLVETNTLENQPVEEMEDVKPNLGLLAASVTKGY